MESTYTLTWEEYAELFSDSWPRPDYFSAVVVAMVSIPLIAYGVTLTVFGMPDEHTISWVFIGGPAFLLLAAVLSVASGNKKAKNEAVAEKRAQYERWHAKAQWFSFDQEKWTLQNESGTLEVPWSALAASVEWPGVFHLIANSGQAIVPKRAMTREMVDQVRSHAALGLTEPWPFKISAWDYQMAETARLWKRHWFRMAFANIFGIVVLVWLFQIWLSSNEKMGIVWGWVIAGFAVVMTLTAQLWYLPLKYWTSPRQWRTPKGLGLTERGLYFEGPYTRSFHDWKSFQTFEEIRPAFLIYTDKHHYYLLAKHYVSDEQSKEVRRRLSENLKEKKASG